MNDNEMTVIRAFRDFDKSAAVIPPQFRSKADNKKNKAARAAKKPWLTKEPISNNSGEKAQDVAVERIDKKAAAAALEAISSMPAAPEERRPSGVTNAKVAQVAHLREMFQANKQKQDQLSAIGNTLEPKTAAAGAQAQTQDPYAAMQELAEHGQLLQKAIPGLDPSVVLQGQQMGVDMSPGGIKKRLGAHEMIARGKKILREEKKNSATNAAGSPAGGNPAAVGQPQEQQPQQLPMVAAAKLYSIDMTKVAQGLAAAGVPRPQKPFALATDLSQPINPQAKLPVMPGAGAASAAAQPQDSAPSETEKQAFFGGLGRLLLSGGGRAMRGIGGFMGRAGLERSGKAVSGAGSKLRRLRVLAASGDEFGTKKGLASLVKASPKEWNRVQDLKPAMHRAQRIEKLTGLGATGLGAAATGLGAARLGSALSGGGGGGGGGAPAPAQKPAKESTKAPKKESTKAPKKEAPKETPVKKASLSKDAAVLRGVLEKQAIFGGIGRLLLNTGGRAMRGIGGFMGRHGLEQSGKMVSGAGNKLRQVSNVAHLAREFGPGSAPIAGLQPWLNTLIPQMQRAQGIAQLAGLGATGLGATALLGSDGGEQKQSSEKSADLGSGVKPLVHESGFRTREGFKNTHRQEVFNDLAKWSLGAKTIG